jgi:hypothetical protein
MDGDERKYTQGEMERYANVFANRRDRSRVTENDREAAEAAWSRRVGSCNTRQTSMDKVKEDFMAGFTRGLIQARAASPQAALVSNKAAAVAAVAPTSHVVAGGDSVTINGRQLLAALDFIAPDRDNPDHAADQLECEATIQRGDGHSGRGIYCWVTDYPDEGAMLLDGEPVEQSPPAPIASAEEAVTAQHMLDAVKPLVDEWIRSRGTSMDGASYFAAVQLAAHVAAAQPSREVLEILSELAVLKRYHQPTNPNCKTVRSSMVNIPHELLDRIDDALKDQP